MNFRDLTAEDVEVRVQSTTEKGVTLLLYKNARVDMNVLDETVGVERWQREHYECKGNLYCRVGIKCDNEWIWKSDCGSESNTDAEKGEASDSFKRACVNWGIGRELYTAPFIFATILNKEGQVQVNVKDKKCKDKFFVGKIEIKDKRIVKLVIGNRTTGKWCYSWQAPNV